MKIAVVGGGPAGLYFSVLLNEADPSHQITVHERNRADDTFGFGVVFSDNTMGFLAEQDGRAYPEIMAASKRWDPLTFIHQGRTVRIEGVGFSAIERRRLLAILQRQALERGVKLLFESGVPDHEVLARENDLVVAADGVNSQVRARLAARLGTRVEIGPTRFTWLGTDREFDSLTFFFERSQHGVLGAHIYPYPGSRSTFIVETDEETWLRAGMDRFSEEDTITYCERVFAPQLEGHHLLSNRSLWQQFRTVTNRTWHHGNVVVIGDAAHTAHFSVGSGTKMAMEDALALSQAVTRFPGELEAALIAFEEERHPRVEHIQRMAASSFEWWASFRHYVGWPAEKFAFHGVTRSQFRYDTLKDRAPQFLAQVEARAEVVKPEALAWAVSAPLEDARHGLPGPAAGPHLAELGRAWAGAITELVAVSAEGRLNPLQPTLESDRHGAEWARVVEVAHGAGVQIGVQIGHAGSRGSSMPASRGLGRPLPPELGWPVAGVEELDEAEMSAIIGQFAAAAARACSAGFDLLQLHFAQGQLLAGFISPLTNHRLDGRGGSPANRLSFPIQVVRAVREVWPAGRPLLVAFAASDWTAGGISEADAMSAAQAFAAAGADYVTALGGQTSPRSTPSYAPCYQMLIAGRIRNEAGVPVVAAGGIADLDDLKTILLSGRADLCLLDSAR